MNTVLAFVAVSAVVIVTPGQDTALVIKSTLAGGRAGGVATALGVSAGQAVWALATSVGLAAILVASERVFLVLKLAGATYLLWLGLHALWNAVRRRALDAEVKATALGRQSAFRQGALSNLGNPKMAVFFTSLLPQFAGDGAVFVELLALGLLFAGLTLAWLCAYAHLIERASRALRRTAVRRALDAVTGVVLVALGLRLVSESSR